MSSLMIGQMSYKFYNTNPHNKLVGDCVIRAISFLLNKSWDEAFIGVCAKAFEMKDMPSSNAVWNAYLLDNGFSKNLLPDTCPYCYTVKDFCRDYSRGDYILSLNGHVVAVSHGDYYDTWDSGDEVPLFYWRKER